MKFLEDRIREDGRVLAGDILKVDSFLNHQIDVPLLDKMGEEFYRHFKTKKIDKILTIEASGIAIACSAARYFRVPVLFAKKTSAKNSDEESYSSTAHSYTRGSNHRVTVSKRYLHEGERILIVDDFLACGEATKALVDIVRQAGAFVEGIGIAVEKGFQEGGKKLRQQGFEVFSLAVIASMGADGIHFQSQ